MPEPLSDDAKAALQALVSAPLAWCFESPVSDAIRALMLEWVRPWCSPAETDRWLDGLESQGIAAATLRSLAKDGWLEPWERPGFPRAWTLTPLGSARLGKQLIEGWSHRRIQREHFAGDRKPPKRQWIRDRYEDPRWGPWRDTEHDRRPSHQPRDGTVSLGMLDVPDDRPSPEAEARVAECAKLIEEFGRTGDMALLRRAESIVEGVTAEARKRWLWDEASDLPQLVMGRPVPRDQRMTRPA